MTESEKIAYLNYFIKVVPYYGEFTPPYNPDELEAASKVIGYKHPDLEKLDDAMEVVQYMVHNGFAIFLHEIKDSGNIIYAQLTDMGRELKELGSIEAYNAKQEENKAKEVAAERDRQLQEKRNHYLYYINLSIAVSTVIAAIYYISEIVTSYQALMFYLPISLLMIIGCTAGILAYLLQLLLQRKDK